MFRYLLAALALAIAPPSLAQCAPRAEIVDRLTGQFAEARQGYGLSQVGVFEVWISPDGTWSITQTGPEGITCIRAHGRDWEARADDLSRSQGDDT